MEVFDIGGGEIEEGREVGDPVREVGKGGGRDGLHGCVVLFVGETIVTMELKDE